MATREHHTQRVRNIAVAGLYATLIGAYLLTFGIPKGCWRAPVKWWRASLPCSDGGYQGPACTGEPSTSGRKPADVPGPELGSADESGLIGHHLPAHRNAH